MAATKKSQYDVIYSVVKRSPKRGVTASTIADRTGYGLNSVRSTLWQLKADGLITVSSTLSTGTVGRPSNVYIPA